jgi:hypothetical protein
VTEAVKRVWSYVSELGKHRVALIVNRVETARETERILRKQAAGKADVVLLTGRIRPYERDQLVLREQKGNEH